MSIQCSNSNCLTENPDNAKFCRKCGLPFLKDVKKNASNVPIEEIDNCPFHLKHPELHLKPISEFEKLFFWFNKPEYVEDPSEAEDSEYLFIARDGKLGILYWTIEKHWYGKEDIYNRIIPCKYDRIEKAEGYFVCHKGSEVTYIDLKGNILK
ncbi:hypothetical protein HMPREF1532_03638 [Bacteroides salyersiae WAL 10018 = DSM 18765 = JCM 12988]|nr:hypothetical protein HMPREF1532_03638 [Bacteroides salyersiae WAL 10018 = DSM 18765 = JCM 12988]